MAVATYLYRVYAVTKVMVKRTQTGSSKVPITKIDAIVLYLIDTLITSSSN